MERIKSRTILKEGSKKGYNEGIRRNRIPKHWKKNEDIRT